MSGYYPVYLRLWNQPCVVIGGGKIAEDKVGSLLSAGARVTVISPDLTPQLLELVEQKEIAHIARHYQPGDLAGAFVVICATGQTDIVPQVWQEALAHRQLINTVDDPPHCTFIAPAILRNGDLTIAISTAGKAPALAVRLKERLQRELGPEYERFLDLAGQLREPLTQHVPDFKARKAIWYELVDSDAISLLAAGDEASALDIISEVVGFHFEPHPGSLERSEL